MMKRTLSILSLVVALALPASRLAAVPASVAPLLQPFVDKHELAGAVALVLDNEKVLSVEAVGFADIAGKRVMKTDSLFWIASQSKPMTATAVLMLVDEGKVALDGKRYLSDAAFKELTRRQTPPALKDSYGLGFSVGDESFGHGGAHATNMEIRPAKGVAIVWMVQHGGFPGDGSKALGVFKNWALERFGK